MKWIKASDFKSDKEETVFAKWEDTGEKFFAIYRPGRGITNISGFHLNKVLVVDESEPSFTLDEAIDIYIYTDGVNSGIQYESRTDNFPNEVIYFKTKFNIDI